MPDGSVAHAELQIGDSILQLSNEMPQIGLRAPSGEWVHSSVVLYCPDVDAAYARAIERGARVVEEVQTFVTGDRFGTIIDPFGHRWGISQHLRDVPVDEVIRAAAQAFTPQPG
jgi:uncharacterized glyoxalase superfamily protein PhnB